jgi:hypothetical protein
MFVFKCQHLIKIDIALSKIFLNKTGSFFLLLHSVYEINDYKCGLGPGP